MALVPSGGAGACKDDAALGLPWSEMFRSASLRRPKQEADDAPSKKPALKKARAKEMKSKPSSVGAGAGAGSDMEGLSLEPDARLALYIAMAHAGLATALLVLYGLPAARRFPPPARRSARSSRSGSPSSAAASAPHCSCCRSPCSGPRPPRSLTRPPRFCGACSRTHRRSRASSAGSSPSSSFSSSSSASTRVAVDFLNVSGGRLPERAKKAREWTETARENFRQLGLHIGKWQVRFAKLLEISYFSPSHLFSRVSKL